MTRNELDTEVKKLERYIDIYNTLISNSLCDCISHIQDKYSDLNKEELEFLVKRINILIPLKKKSDEALKCIPHIPIQIPC
jgi:hypothetical protein